MINEANRNVGKVEPFTQEYIDEYRKMHRLTSILKLIGGKSC